MDKVAERTEAREPAAEARVDEKLTPGAAREYVDGLTDSELIALAAAVERGIEQRQHLDSSAIGGQPSATAGWDYQREPWSYGHIQKDPRPRKMKDGSTKVYGYWYFHWIADGQRKSQYIGSDDALASWKSKNPK